MPAKKLKKKAAPVKAKPAPKKKAVVAKAKTPKKKLKPLAKKKTVVAKKKNSAPKAKAVAKKPIVVAKPIAKPIAKPTAKPIAKPIAKPVAKKPPQIVESLTARMSAGARAVFTEMRASAPGAHFYFFALFTTADGSYVAGTAGSEEALLETAQKSVARRGGELADTTKSLRFSAADSPFHDFESDILGSLRGAGVHEACFEALATLDREGFFGRGVERESIVLNVVYGDMSDERWLAHARRLNDDASIARALPYLRLNQPSGDTTAWGAFVSQVNTISLTKDRTRVAYSGSGGHLGVLEVKGHRALFEERLGRDHWASVLAPDGSQLFVGHEEGAIVLEVSSKKTRPLFKSGKPSSMALSPDGTRLAVASWEGRATLRDSATGAIRWSADEETGPFAFAPDGSSIAALCATEAGRTLQLLDAETGKARWSFALDAGLNASLTFAPDGRTILACVAKHGATSSTLVRLDSKTGKPAKSISVKGEVSALAFAPSGQRIGMCVRRELVVIDLAGRELARGAGKQESMSACAFASDTELLGVGRNVDAGPAILALRVPS